MNEWEKKLKEGEEKLSNLRKILNEKEEKANENEMVLKQKEKYLDEAERKIEFSSSIVKEKEDDVTKRLADLVSKEKVRVSHVWMSFFFFQQVQLQFCPLFSVLLILLQELDSKWHILEMKENKLHALEKKLSSRENVSRKLQFPDS